MSLPFNINDSSMNLALEGHLSSNGSSSDAGDAALFQTIMQKNMGDLSQSMSMQNQDDDEDEDEDK